MDPQRLPARPHQRSAKRQGYQPVVLQHREPIGSTSLELRRELPEIPKLRLRKGYEKSGSLKSDSMGQSRTTRTALN
jgi:hypothetical protein